MNITTKRQTPLASVLACVGLLLIAGQAAAAEYWLCAKAGNVTMPDGAVVPIWGYVQDDSSVGGNLINNLSDGCAGTPTLPGPPLAVPADDLGLTVHLRNDLTAPTSIVIPGIPSAASFTGIPNGDMFLATANSRDNGRANASPLERRGSWYSKNDLKDAGPTIMNASTVSTIPAAVVHASSRHFLRASR